MIRHHPAILTVFVLSIAAAPVRAQGLASTGGADPAGPAHPSGLARLRDEGTLCVFDPAVPQKLRELRMLTDPATGDTFVAVSPSVRPLPLGLLYPPRRSYVTLRPWYEADPPLAFAGRSYRRHGPPVALPLAEMRPVGTTADTWLFERRPAAEPDVLYAASGPGCQFQPYHAETPAVAGARASRGVAPRHRLLGYLTDRQPTTSERPAEHFGGDPGQLVDGVADVTITPRHRLGTLETAPWLARTDTLSHIVLQRLQVGVPAPQATRALVYIHGYYNSFEDASRRAAQLAEDLDFDGDVYFFSWPSQARLLGYPADAQSVRRSRPDFKQVLGRLVQAYGPGRVSVIAHSLGTRGLGQAVQDLAATGDVFDHLAGRAFDQVVIASPDEDLTVFREQWTPALLDAANRVTVYASPADRALFFAKRFNGGIEAGSNPNVFAQIPGIDVIDTSPLSEGWLRLGGWLRHSDYAENPAVLGDLYLLLRGRTPAQRGLVQVPGTDGGTYWTFR